MNAALTHQGLPSGIARKDLLLLIENLGKRGLGISSTALHVLRHYVWRSRDADYRTGRICAVWEKVSRTAEKLELCPRAINDAERELEGRGLIVRTTGGNGARSGLRVGDVIRWAVGINLKPLISRYVELQSIWEARYLHQLAIVETRAEIRRLRRSIRDCQQLEFVDKAEAILPRGPVAPITDLARLESIKTALELILCELEGAVRRPKTSDASEENCRPHIQTQHTSRPCTSTPEGR